jgi:hypothetical protein
MPYREIIAVCSEIHAKHKCSVGRTQNFCLLKLVVRKVSLRLWKAYRTLLVARMFVVSVVFCQIEGSTPGWSLIQGSTIDSGVSECDLETPLMWRSWPALGRHATPQKTHC